MSRVKVLDIIAVRTFGLAVMPRRIRTNEFVLDTTLFEQLLKQRGAIASGRESIDKLGTVIGLNAFCLEFENLQHIFEERGRGKSTQFIKAFTT